MSFPPQQASQNQKAMGGKSSSLLQGALYVQHGEG